MALPPALISLLDPWLFMGLALSYLPATLLSSLLTLDFRTLLSPSRLQSAWFGRFWKNIGPTVRTNAEKNVLPLLQGRVSHGVIHPPPSSSSSSSSSSPSESNPHPPISGTLLELGPGTGLWTSLFSASSQSTHSLGPLTKIYGIEPNPSVHAELRQRLNTAGITNYEIIPLGIQDLHLSQGKIQPGSIDTILTIMCLCSIPSPEENIRELYKYLKPGGRWYVYEHVKCFASQPRGMHWYQRFLNLIWPRVIGGCEMCRDTAKYLREAGEWSEIDLAPLEQEPWHYTMPHLIGVLRK